MQTDIMSAASAPSALLMVVDDDDALRESIAIVLTARGFRVLEHESGQTALEALERGEHPDLILLDLMMPVMDGWEFRRRQLADTALASIPVVAMSGSGAAQASILDASAFLAKPMVAADLLGTVEGVLKHQDEVVAPPPKGHVRRHPRDVRARARSARALGPARERSHAAAVRAEAQRNRELALVSRAMSHVVNNALQNLMSYAQCLIEGEPEKGELRDLAFERAFQCSALLLRFARCTEREPRALPKALEPVPHAILEAWRQRCPASVELHVSGLHLLRRARVTPELLLLATAELIGNAVEALDAGKGNVSVAVTRRLLQRPSLDAALPVCNRRPGLWCCVEVSDDGRGIAASELPQIWSPFYSTKFADRGLGLAEVLALMSTHGGLVDAESALGVGTTVRLLFPLAP